MDKDGLKKGDKVKIVASWVSEWNRALRFTVVRIHRSTGAVTIRNEKGQCIALMSNELEKIPSN